MAEITDPAKITVTPVSGIAVTLPENPTPGLTFSFVRAGNPNASNNVRLENYANWTAIVLDNAVGFVFESIEDRRVKAWYDYCIAGRFPCGQPKTRLTRAEQGRFDRGEWPYQMGQPELMEMPSVDLTPDGITENQAHRPE